MPPLAKTISIAVASAISALIFGLVFKGFIGAGTLLSLVFLLLAIIVFQAVFLIQSLLINNFLVNLGIVAFDSVLIMAVFFNQLSFLMLFAGLSIIGFLIVAYYNAQLELKNNLEVRFFKISNHVMRYASSALAIFAIISYLSLLNLEDPASARRALAIAVKPSEPIIAAYIPGYKATDSLVQIAAKIMPPDVKISSQAVQNNFIEQSSIRLSQVIGGYINSPVSPRDNTLDIAYKATVAKLLKFSPTVQGLILFGAGILIFFVVKVFLIVVNWAATFLAFGIYQLLWGSGFFKIEMQSKTKKVIVLESTQV